MRDRRGPLALRIHTDRSRRWSRPRCGGRVGRGGGWRLEQLAVDRLGLRRGVGPELVGEQPSALLVHTERFGSVAGSDVRFHQAAISALPERRERDRLFRPLHGLSRVARTQGCVSQHAQRAVAELGELASLLLDPRTVLAREKGLRQQCRSLGGQAFRLLEVACRERVIRFVRGVRRREHVDPGLLGQLEPVAAERARKGAVAVDAAVGEERAKLADDDAQRLVPGRRRCLRPERLRELVSWHRPARLGHQVCEQQPALPSWKVRLVDHLSVGFDCDSACEKDLQLESSCALPGS